MDLDGETIVRSIYDDPAKLPSFGYFNIRTNDGKYLPIGHVLNKAIEADSVSYGTTKQNGMPVTSKGLSFKDLESKIDDSVKDEEDIDR